MPHNIFDSGSAREGRRKNYACLSHGLYLAMESTEEEENIKCEDDKHRVSILSLITTKHSTDIHHFHHHVNPPTSNHSFT